MTPNRIKITMDGGTAEIYGDIFSRMLTCFALAMYDQQKRAQEKLGKINLDDDLREVEIRNTLYEHDEARFCLKVIEEVEKVFKNGSTHGGTRPLPMPITYVQPGPKEN